jgi:PadR family transcriptional regulator PadR
MEELTSFQRDILHVIAGLERPHGLAVKHELQDYYGKEVNHGRLYPNMDQLSEQGLVDKSKRDERSNTYVITELGKEMLALRHHWQKSYFKPSAKLNAAVQSD